ncbi:MAG TPA: MgtC/SapB family protein [Anaerohalosphaeraceae bacterium]|jgi:putative Mg2+ transporter-C (MgtC) family protein|nr:MgtC/SapB family protein [Anaerohalosphaeraceae bacterium]HRT48921.1 MgtC/SapB family protein [Anaerohalosphaeraceae bacterium]HRT85044.1 MgtC/SapB family protein [Anaerohalosphaeraceae bacterium]
MDMTVTWHDVASLLFAVLLGGAIGLEREITGKPAGLRTNMIICLGATVFTLVTVRLGMEAGAADAGGRIAAGIVTGVGFLGAGALLQEGSGVHGLTTAASIWLVASIGVACGVGYYILATLVTFIALVVLCGLLPIARRIRRYRRVQGPDQ